MIKKIKIGKFEVNNYNKLFLVAGPCVIESRDHALFHAKKIKQICDEISLDFVFKSSFDKANRTNINSKRGVGLEKGLDILNEIKNSLNVPVLTDIHESYQCDFLKEVVDIIQIPAFLCRQTDLLLNASNTGRIINIKKGQFLAPWDMVNVIEKIKSTGNQNIILTERGSSFGYNNLVFDLRSLIEMKKTGYPVVFDATHSVQSPGGLGNVSGGNREYIPFYSNAAVTVGISGIFMEVHENPDKAPSDGPNMIKLDKLKNILKDILKIDQVIKRHSIGNYNEQNWKYNR